MDQDRKRELLAHLVKSGNWRPVLVFCRTKHGANRLAEQLASDGIQTAAIHGDKSPPQRTKALAGFKSGELQVLVATDIASRGLDIESPPHVVNYDLPQVPANYAHRAGCAGASGRAVSLVSGEDRGLLRDIERLIGRNIEQQIVAGFEPGEGYHSAQPEPELRRDHRPQGVQSNPRRRPERPRNAQRGPQRPQAPAQARQGNGRRRDPRPERQPVAFSPTEQTQDAVRQEQLEYHRQQQAAERRAENEPSQQAAERRAESEPAREQKKEQDAPALFGVVGRK